MFGDPEQYAAVEAGPVIKLMQDGLGKGAVPEIVTNVRQKTEAEQIGSCPHRDDTQLYTRCDPYCQTLVELFGPPEVG